MEQAAQILIGGILQGSVFGIVALGFTLVFRVTGAINLSQGAFCILAAYVMFSLERTAGWPPLAAAAGAALATALAALVIGATTFVPALSRLPTSSMFILTAGLLTFLEGLCLVIWGSEPYALPPFSGEAPLSVAGIRVPTQGLWIAGATVAIIVGIWWLLMRTALGEALRACAENPAAARLMGIGVERMTLFSFTLAAFIAALGGIVVAPILSFQFDTGRFFTISGFSAVAIGGLGSFVGAVAGGELLGAAEQLAAGYISSLFANGIALGLLILTLLVRPSGLFVARRTRREDVRDEHRIYHPLVRLRGRRGAAFGAIAIVLAAALPWMVPDGLMSSLVITGILFIAVLGLDVLMGYAGQVSLGQAGFMAVGGYSAAILATNHGWSPLLGTAAGLVLSLACALLLSLVTMRLRGHYLALATLAFGLLVDSLTVGMTELTGGPSGLVGIPAFAIGDFAFDTPLKMYYLVAALLVAVILILLGGIRSGFGRALQAVRTDQTAAAALGVDVPRYKMAAFAISAALASLSGSLYAFFFHFLSPEMVGTQRSLEMIAMLVVGGEGTLVGPVFGVALLTLLPTIFQPLAVYKTLAEGVLLVATVRYLPGGIFGTVVGTAAARLSR
ncbi:MAG TPA: ABC transporter permease [Burkholderiales bacterium]|nr:ABC transporter permease [Burkholderiales bacterium]